jgi:hypothetical protein
MGNVQGCAVTDGLVQRNNKFLMEACWQLLMEVSWVRVLPLFG